MSNSYLFYDIETTGLNKCFDQVIQFAAIRTDTELNELERFEQRIKLNADVVPAPEAIMTHHISLDSMQQGACEVEAMQTIHALLNAPNTISLGYNTLNFDDEFLRFSFYRNLLPPYTHQFANGCQRMDLYPMLLMYYLFKPDSLIWPQKNGLTSLKLENLNATNQLAVGTAHDAMVDVQATLALAKKLKSHPEMWQYVCGYFNKKIDLERTSQLPVAFATEHMRHREAIMLDGKLGYKANFLAPVLCLGQHQHYKNQSLWLRLDHEALRTTHADTIAETTWVIKKRAAENQLLLPPKARFSEKLGHERLQLAHANLAWLKANPDLLQLICDYHQNYKYPVVAAADIDAKLYDIGFATATEERLFQQFHRATIKDKEKIAAQITNPVRREQAMRILARHYPQAIATANQQQFCNYLNSIRSNTIIQDFRGEQHLTWAAAAKKIEALLIKNELSSMQKKLLENYLNTITHSLSTS